MKSSDIALIILIAVLSFGISWYLSGLIFGDPSEDVRELAYIEAIDGSLAEPDVETFNPKAIDPVVEVIIGDCKVGTHWSEKDQTCIEDTVENKDDENVVEEDSDENQQNN